MIKSICLSLFAAFTIATATKAQEIPVFVSGTFLQTLTESTMNNAQSGGALSLNLETSESSIWRGSAEIMGAFFGKRKDVLLDRTFKPIPNMKSMGSAMVGLSYHFINRYYLELLGGGATVKTESSNGFYGSAKMTLGAYLNRNETIWIRGSYTYLPKIDDNNFDMVGLGLGVRIF